MCDGVANSKLPLYTNGPMNRHASTDWSDPKEFHKFSDAKALDVSVRRGLSFLLQKLQTIVVSLVDVLPM